jgi:kumamolisin
MTDSGADSFVPLPGSERGPLPAAEQAGPVDESQRIVVTLVTRRRSALPWDLVETPATVTREQLAEQHGTDPADIDFLRIVLAQYGLQVTDADPGARQVKVEGSLAALSEAFGAELSLVRTPQPGPGQPAEHRYRQGELRIPAELNGIVLAVLGLDNRPQARPHFRRAPTVTAEAAGTGSGTGAAAPAAASVSYPPPQVAELYKFPAGTDGTGHTLAIIELGGGFGSNDLDAYFGELNLPVPSVTAASVDGAVNAAGQDPNGADGEVLLDIEVAGSVAPGAAQVVYFAPNTDQGFVDAVSTAVHASPTPTAISISWGQSEDAWTAQGRTALDEALADAAALGITVCVAAGDNGSGDAVTDGQPHTDFPASSPHALACGGTALHGDAASGTISSETVWNDGAGQGATGGGVSDTFPLPSWQAAAGVPARAGSPAGTAPGRGVPDVAGCADPQTGYQVLVDGQSMVVGGTSAVAPLWAALVCRMAQSTGKPFGLLQPLVYAGVPAGTAAAGFQDITSGNNGAYAAGPGWDACTGLGSPDGTALLGILSAALGSAATPPSS